MRRQGLPRRDTNDAVVAPKQNVYVFRRKRQRSQERVDWRIQGLEGDEQGSILVALARCDSTQWLTHSDQRAIEQHALGVSCDTGKERRNVGANTCARDPNPCVPSAPEPTYELPQLGSS